MAQPSRVLLKFEFNWSVLRPWFSGDRRKHGM
jgi:hypothetical protein